MANSAAVSVDDDVVIAQYNNLRLDVLDPTTGHIHDGTFGKIIPKLYLPNDGLQVKDTNASHYLIIKPGSDLSADRILTITTGDAARTLTLNGNPTLDDWFDQAVKQASKPTFAGASLTGYSTLGASSPSIKFKRFTGTTYGSEGGGTSINHELTGSKIIGAFCIVFGDTYYVPPETSSVGFAGYQYSVVVTSTQVRIMNHATNSESILSKTFIVTLIYEE